MMERDLSEAGDLMDDGIRLLMRVTFPLEWRSPNRPNSLGLRRDQYVRDVTAEPELIARGQMRQCVATAKQSGVRCKRLPIPGGTVCVMHGGKAPAVQQTAKGRLAELVMPSIATLDHERRHAKRSSDRQRAANSILDRAGMGRMKSSDMDAKRALLIERLRAIREEHAGEALLELTAAPEDIEDAEVLDADDAEQTGS